MNDPEQRIRRVWSASAAPWTRAVREGRIASRRLVTDEALLAAVRGGRPRRVLDIGCGEGWLARALSTSGASVLGIDAAPELVERAREAGGGEFRVMDFDAVGAGALAGGEFDVAVANFSLLGDAPVRSLLAALPGLLGKRGRFVLQTLHPLTTTGDGSYRDGWREGSWAGIDGEFGEPAPWYFRTIGGWLTLIARSGLTLSTLQEPLHPQHGQPMSLLIEAQPQRAGDGAR